MVVDVASGSRRICLAWCLLHFLAIALVSGHDIVWMISRRLPMLPAALVALGERIEPVSAAAFGENLPSTNPIRRGLLTYFRAAGIDRGYGYFAPNIPGSYRLVFELHYPDGRLEHELPAVSSRASALRLASLLDEIGRAEPEAFREYLIRGITRSVWREHPEVTSVRAIFGLSVQPSIREFERGNRESYEFLYAYDFSRQEKSADGKAP